jgi:HNH endonuclease
LTKVPWQIDHIQAKSRGGSEHPTNFQILCATCNNSKGAKTIEEWRPWLLKDGRPIVSWSQFGWKTPEIRLDEKLQKKFEYIRNDRVKIIGGVYHGVIGVCKWADENVLVIKVTSLIRRTTLHIPISSISSMEVNVVHDKLSRSGKRRRRRRIKALLNGFA